jgi:hypothetical protein
MDTTSVAYVLCRIEDDSSLTPISEHQDIVAAVVAGKDQVEVEDFDFSYGVYANGARVICFAEGRIGYREWARTQPPRTTPGIGQATPVSGASLATLAALVGSPTPPKRGISLDLHYSEPTQRTQPLERCPTSTRKR